MQCRHQDEDRFDLFGGGGDDDDEEPPEPDEEAEAPKDEKNKKKGTAGRNVCDGNLAKKLVPFRQQKLLPFRQRVNVFLLLVYPGGTSN